MSYGVDILKLFRQAAAYADRILKGRETRQSAGTIAHQV
jgi:hypothetical protein